MAIDDQAFYTARVLKSLGFSMEQVAKTTNLDFHELTERFKNMEYSPKNKLEDALNQTLIDIADVINDEKKKAVENKSVRDNRLILDALKQRREVVRELYEIEEEPEIWTFEKLKQKVGEFKNDGKMDRVFECLRVMGFEGLDYDTLARKLKREYMNIIAKVVECDFNTVQSALYKLKVQSWEDIRKNRGLGNFLDKKGSD